MEGLGASELEGAFFLYIHRYIYIYLYRYTLIYTTDRQIIDNVSATYDNDNEWIGRLTYRWIDG